MPENALTSALNATVITGNGNEGLLLNDMGNTLIKDSITGNIMSLSNGFIPLGMKERGGILYIASYNPETNEGELGTIPSPIIHYTYNSKVKNLESNLKLSDITANDSEPEGSTNENISVSDRIYKAPIYILSDLVFHAGDKFIVFLNLDLAINSLDGKLITTTKTYYYIDTKLNTLDKLESPQISTINQRGWFKIKLFAVDSAGEMTELTNVTNKAQKYYTIGNGNTVQESDYWFIMSNSSLDLNINKTRTQNLFNTFPNIQSGRLAIQIEEELPGELDWLENKDFGKNLPQIVYNIENDEAVYYAVVHGFQYKNGLCPIRPDRIDITCNFPIYYTIYDSESAHLNSGDGQYSLTLYSSVEDKIDPEHLNYADFPKYENENTKYITSTNSLQSFLIRKGDVFLINKQLHDCASYENYDDKKTDGLFFIKLDDLSKQVEVDVRLYTKSFDNSPNSYVLYSEQKLTRFTPSIELGINSNFTIITKDQYLDITESKVDNTFDLHLFPGADKKNALGKYDDEEHNACFLYDGDLSEYNATDCPILTYDDSTKQYGKYVEKAEGHTIGEYSKLKTWIYPIITAEYSTPSISEGSVNWNDVEFLWTDNNYILYKNILSRNSLDGLPTYRLPALPRIKVTEDNLEKEYPYLLPIKQTDTEIEKQYLSAIKAKQHANEITNEFGLNAGDLKHFSIYNTNLTCLKEQLQSNNYQITFEANKSSNREGNPFNGEEQFFKQTNADCAISIWRDKNIKILSPADQKYQPCEDFNNCTDLTITRDNPENSYVDFDWFIDVEKTFGYRGYGLGSVIDSGQSYMIWMLKVPFLSFLIQSTPGFVPAQKKYNPIFNFLIFKYNNSLKYLYTEVPEIIFTNYKDIDKDIDKDFITTINYLTTAGKHTYSSYWTACAYNTNSIAGYTYKFKSELFNGYNKIQQLDISKSINLDVAKDIPFKKYSTDILGLNDSQNIKIPVDLEQPNVAISGFVQSAGFDEGDSYDKIPFDDINSVALNKIIQSHLLTSVLSNLFVDKCRSNITYNNKSDYRVDCLLKSESGYWNNNGIILENNTNVDISKNFLVREGTPDRLDGSVGNFDKTLKTPYTLAENSTSNPRSPKLNTKELNLVNSFCNDSEFVRISKNELILSRDNDNTELKSGLYVFNLNYFIFENQELQINIKLDLDGTEQTLKNNVGGTTISTFAFYVPEDCMLRSCEIKLKVKTTTSTSTTITNTGTGKLVEFGTLPQTTYLFATYYPAYIRNLGLFKVNLDAIDPASKLLNKKLDGITNFTQITDPDILSCIIFPATFCFRELDKDGNKLGCLDEEYAGFQMLPETAAEKIYGVYYLGDDNKAVLKSVADGLMVANALPNKLSDLINKITIRHEQSSNNNN